MRDDLFGAVVRQGEHGPTIRHHRGGALGDGREAVDRDVHGQQEVIKAGIDIAAAQLVLVGKADGVDEEIDRGPFSRQCGEAGVRAFHRRHIAFEQAGDTQCFGQRAHPLFHHRALVAEGQFGALFGQGLGNAPGQALVVRQPHDEAAFSRHDSHEILLGCAA